MARLATDSWSRRRSLRRVYAPLCAAWTVLAGGLVWLASGIDGELRAASSDKAAEQASASDSQAEPPPPKLSRLGKAPDWTRLDPYQEGITRDEFTLLLEQVYAGSDQAWRDTIELLPDRARIVRQSNWPAAGSYELRFRGEQSPSGAVIHRSWRPVRALRPPLDPTRPLADLHVCIDPGHIGGNFAVMEARHYRIGEGTLPVTEGDMTLLPAFVLRDKLEALGARVSLTRDKAEPVTTDRPASLEAVAREYLTRESGRERTLLPRGLVEQTAKRLFYVSSEIRARAQRVNEELKPDLVLCLHFNAEAWGDPRNPTFSPKNHFHVLVNGAYSAGEFAEDDQRLELLLRLLQRTYREELGLAESMARSLARETGLDPYVYTHPKARKVGLEPGVWARDLLANRSYLCPVVFFEPYVMNNREVHARVQAGSYEGTRTFGGRQKVNLYEEYASAVSDGLVAFVREQRP